MKKIIFAALVLIGIIGNHGAQASSDETCGPSWSLSGIAYDSCNSVPFLSPTNDTQINLLLLMADEGGPSIPAAPLTDYDRSSGYGLVPFSADVLLAPAATDQNSTDTAGDYATGEGTRCHSNNGDTAQAFINQMATAGGLSDEERTALTESRKNLINSCDGSTAATTPANLQSPAAKEFALYLTGAQAFYAGDFAAAHQAFSSLGNSSQAWLKETSLYMIARTDLNAAQVNAFDESGFPKIENVNQAALKDAEAGFNAYLQAYSQGLYASSAHGLLRRVYWLMNDQERLAGMYGEAIAHGVSAADQALTLAQEVDGKLLTGADPTKIRDPLLLTVVDLMAMRATDNGQPETSFTADMLTAQQPLFAGHQDLYAYLQAAYHFYVEKNPTQTLAALPDIDASKPLSTYLSFSAAMLRGLALEEKSMSEKSDGAAARAFWVKLFPLVKLPLAQPTLEVALAANQERAHQLDAVFAADSLVQSSEIRMLLLRKTAGPALLRQQIQMSSVPQEQRDLALFVLLYKDLTRGHYQDFAGDLQLAPLPNRAALPDDLAVTYVGGAVNLSMFTAAANAADQADSSYACPSLEKVAARLQQNKSDPLGLNCLGEFIRASFDYSPLDRVTTADGPATDEPADALGASASDFQGPVFSRLQAYQTVIADTKAGRNDKAYALYRAINCFAPSGNNDCDERDIPKSERKKWFQMLKAHYGDTTWGSLPYYW